MDDIILERRAVSAYIRVLCRFYFNYLSAEIGQVFCRKRTRAHPAEITDSYSFQWTFLCCHSITSLIRIIKRPVLSWMTESVSIIPILFQKFHYYVRL